MKNIFAAARNKEEFEEALKSSVDTVFLLNSDILTLKTSIDEAHRAGKRIFIYFDFVEGLGKDKCGMRFIRILEPDGIISVRANIIKMARECGIVSIQRFFIVDSRAVDTAVDMIESAKPDMIELMPGIAYKAIKEFVGRVKVPVIAGGLISDGDEAEKAIEAGAVAVSTGEKKMWR